MDLVNSHKDQRKRLTAIEEESSERRRSAVAAILDQSTQTHHSRNETKRIISSTSQENLANILSKLCDRDDNTQKFIAGELLKCKTTPVMASASASTSTSKRNLPRISKTVEEICRVCGETYDASEEDLTECFYHPGRKEVDNASDFWDDHDEECHGDMESFADDESYAEGFVWTCCGEYGEAEGCDSTAHKPSTKRSRT